MCGFLNSRADIYLCNTSYVGVLYEIWKKCNLYILETDQRADAFNRQEYCPIRTNVSACVTLERFMVCETVFCLKYFFIYFCCDLHFQYSECGSSYPQCESHVKYDFGKKTWRRKNVCSETQTNYGGKIMKIAGFIRWPRSWDIK